MNKEDIKGASFIALGNAIGRLKDALNEYEACPKKYKVFLEIPAFSNLNFLLNCTGKF